MTPNVPPSHERSAMGTITAREILRDIGAVDEDDDFDF